MALFALFNLFTLIVPFIKHTQWKIEMRSERKKIYLNTLKKKNLPI